MEHNIHVIEASQVGNGTSYINAMPYPLDEEKNEAWYLSNVMFITSFYNNSNYAIQWPWGMRELGVDQPDWWNGTIAQFCHNYSYLLQLQPNVNSQWLVENVGGQTNSNRTAQFIRGGRVASIVEKMVGTLRKMYEDVRFTADPLSASAKSVKDKIIEKEEALYLIKPAWDKYIKDLLQSPQQAKPFESPEEFEEWKETGIKDFLATKVYLPIVKDVYEKQSWADFIDRGFIDVLACDCVGLEHLVENGYPRTDLVHPIELIVDNRFDDPYGRERRFSGRVRTYNLTELYYRYPQLEQNIPGGEITYREELWRIATNQGSWSSLANFFPNITWWSGATSEMLWNKVDISVVRVYWIAPELIEGEIFETVYTAEVIAGKYLVNYGKASNIIEDPYKPQVPMLPLQITTPNMLLGRYNSLVSRVKFIQDDYDVLRYKKMEMVGKSNGMIPVFDMSRFDGDHSIVDLYTEIKKYGMTGIGKSGEPNNPADNRLLVDQLDQRLDPSFPALTNELKEIIAEIEMYVGQTEVTLGESNRYIGKDTYNDSKEVGAMGTYNIYQKYLRFIAINLSYETEVIKCLIESGELADDPERIIGEQGLRILKKLKHQYLREYGIVLKLNDKLSQIQIQGIFDIAKAYAQNPQDIYTLEDLTELYTASTITKVKDKVKEIDRKHAKQSEQRTQAMMQAKNQEMAVKMEHEKQLAVLNESGKEKGNVLRAESNTEKDSTKREIAGLPPHQGQQNVPLPMQQQLLNPQQPNTGE